MSVEDTDKIDICRLGETGTVELFITDHLPWGEPEHLLTLQNKLNSYLEFVESGQYRDHVEAPEDAPVRIEIVMKYAPDSEAETFLFEAGRIAGEFGVPLSYQVMG